MIYPRIIAHRCGGALTPENTLAGLRVAARLGCRGVEFDAMLAADGLPVLIHDETLERTTSGRGRVAEMSTAQLARIDAGSRHHPAFAEEVLPTLDEALRLCAALGLWANVEIKPSVGDEVETGRMVARHAAAANGHLLLSSFSAAALCAAADQAGQLLRALLVEVIPDDWARAHGGVRCACPACIGTRAHRPDAASRARWRSSVGLLHGQSPTLPSGCSPWASARCSGPA
ncbi:MAG: glycerophosphodiester phosphodiesterase [Sulfuritalea sp.]|nr:glycerophosphodiester phosphodiesterase [Sulfuritalea sp.]